MARVFWAHDFAERLHTGWFFVPLDSEGEPDHARRRRLSVSPDVERLVADTQLRRPEWLVQAETVELVTAAAAVAAARRLLSAHGG